MIGQILQLARYWTMSACDRESVSFILYGYSFLYIGVPIWFIQSSYRNPDAIYLLWCPVENLACRVILLLTCEVTAS